jgi:hypothetical protein
LGFTKIVILRIEIGLKQMIGTKWFTVSSNGKYCQKTSEAFIDNERQLVFLRYEK